MKRWFGLWPMLLLLLPGSIAGYWPAHGEQTAANGTTYYVATDGNNENAGTQDAPFATINKALAMVEAGDTVMVRGGTYNLTERIWTEATGTADARIVLQAYPDETPVLDCSNTEHDSSCLSAAGQYMDIVGFEVRNAQRTGISVWGGSHIRIRNNVVHGSVRGGIYAGYDDMTTVKDIVIEGNTVYDNCQENNPPPPEQGSGWPSGIGVFNTTGAVIANNRVYENYGEGIIMGLMDDGEAYGNVVYDNYSIGMYMDNATNVTYRNNLIYTTNNPTFYRFGLPANGIQIANEIYDHTNISRNNHILNNIIIGARKGFSYGNYHHGGGLQNVVVAHNTFYHSGGALISIDEDSGHQHTEIYNNIFYQTGDSPPVTFAGESGITFHHNSWYGGDAGPAAGEGDSIADPLLVNPGSTTPTDYRLQAGSPLIDAGATSDLVQDDYAGTARPVGSGYDIGAYEYTGGNAPEPTTEPTPTTAPEPTTAPAPTTAPVPSEVVYLPMVAR